MHICCLGKASKEGAPIKPPRFVAAHEKTVTLENGKTVTRQYMDRIEFNRDMRDCQFAYTGDFVVWKQDSSTVIKYTDVNWLKENAKMRQSLRIKSRQDVRTRDISLRDYVTPETRDLVTIDSCDVAQTMKQTQKSEFNDNVRIQQENFLEVTIRNRVIVFDLQLKQALPINEQGTVDMLMDPQQYVEFGLQLAEIKKRTSNKVITEDNVPFGGYEYTHILTLERSTAGDLLFLK